MNGDQRYLLDPAGQGEPDGPQAEVRHDYEYAVLRAVPRVERGEFVNVGVLLYCRRTEYLGARTHLDQGRLLAIDPVADVAGVRRALRGVEAVCEGGPAAGPAAGDSPGRRFRWLTAPRSAVLQPGPVHTGLTADPEAELRHLFGLMVL
ncbi:DUF3037 domain-containing protein [Kitasatospora sp. NPDC048540]|uniref:DUF3037 domain-containing protein n=1 Tax=unclassified Kitasatospora TaxID=2633591 RepID=UPI0009EB3362|nr:DUF3037 domain-containing protein [Kitasatospora sp. MBT63]